MEGGTSVRKNNRQLYEKKIISVLLAVIFILSSTLPVYGASGKNTPALSTKKITLRTGISKSIKIKNNPAGAKATWKSSNKKVASVKGGTVTGRKEGKAVITCKVTYRESGKKVTKKLQTKVTVKKTKAVYPEHKPYGKGVGVKPGRVVWSHNPKAVKWNGKGYWWKTEHFNEKTILKMVRESISSLGGVKRPEKAWKKLFAAKNGKNKARKKIAIKANINGSGVFDDDDSGRTKMSYTNPVLLRCLLLSLVKDAGIKPSDITVYDVSKIFPEYMIGLCTAGELKGVKFTGRKNGTADKSKQIRWSYPFKGAVNYLPTCVTEADYVINLANLKGHSYGITLCGKNHFGSFINGNAMRPPEGANLHQFLTMDEMGIYSPLVDLMANKELGGKTVLYMLDALICAPSEGDDIIGKNAKWKQYPFNGGYTSSIFVSQDPVAIDSVGADFLMNEPAVTNNNDSLKNNATVENYLHEAGLVKNAPSGIVYQNGSGKKVSNLGVHEHWNNPVDRKYSRNRGKKEGIELIQILH